MKDICAKVLKVAGPAYMNTKNAEVSLEINGNPGRLVFGINFKQDGAVMKCINPNCGGEWTPPSGKSITVCPFCQEPAADAKKSEPAAGEKNHPPSFDNVADTLVYIKERLGPEILLGAKMYTYFADLTHNQFRDETELIKQLGDKGALDCLKAAIGKSASEHEAAIKGALAKLSKYLRDSPAVKDMLHDFAAALGWAERRQTAAPPPGQSRFVAPDGNNTGIIVVPAVGSLESLAGIEWRVLAVENNKALLISEKILLKRPYNVRPKAMTWENCDLRKYLNGEFLNKLDVIKSAIGETLSGNPDNPWHGTAGGNATADKVFLLSLDELVRYFGDSGDLANKRRKNYDGSRDSYGNYLYDRYNSARVADYESEDSWWWLRSPGSCGSITAYVDEDGSVDVGGHYVDDEAGGVRPALWLNL